MHSKRKTVKKSSPFPQLLFLISNTMTYSLIVLETECMHYLPTQILSEISRSGKY